MRAMMRALSLSLRQLADARTLRLLLLTVALTLLLFAGAGVILWWALDAWLLPRLAGPEATIGAAPLALLLTIAGGWFLFRAVAMLVIGLFTDGVVESVEEDHFPDVAARAVPVGVIAGLRLGLRSALRAIGWNLLALPAYIVLLVTGVGTFLLALVINAALLGRDLEAMAASRHPSLGPRPLLRGERWWLGLFPALLFLVPFLNLLAPVFGAALAVHMLHGRRAG